ncbi:MAG: adenylate cyclase, partial [Pseudomonadota bacterium]
TGRFVPIITDFTRTTQPIVRYRLDDVLVEDTQDESLYTRLHHIEGRCDDILYLKSGNNELQPVFADAIRQIMTVSQVNFEDYKIIQQSPDNIEIFIEPEITENLQKILCNEFHSFCNRQSLKMPQVRFGNYRPHSLHQKRRRIERRFIYESNNKIGIYHD